MYSTRSYLTAGVAVVGASALALTPVAPMARDLALAPREISTLAVALAASQGATVDPITLWVDTIQEAIANAVALVTAYTANPFPIVQQVIANLITFVGELPNFSLIINQLVSSTVAGLQAPFVANAENVSTVPFQTIPLPPPLPSVQLSQQTVYGLLPDVLAPETYAALEPLLEFTTTPISGALLGLIGPVASPLIALRNSFDAIISALAASDFATAINELINAPAYAVGAFLNGGQFVNLANLLQGDLPPSITKFGLNLGGLLSPGGVGFDSVAANGTFQILPAPLPAINLVDPGFPLGPIGAAITIDNAIADAIAVTPPSASAATQPAAAEEVSAPDAADTDTAAASAPQSGADRSDGASSAKREQRRGSRGAAADKAGASDSDSAGKSASRASAARRAG